MTKNNLIDLAKSGKEITKAAKKTTKKPAAKKSAKKVTAKKVVVKEQTPEELRDLKAKKTVEKLLEDSPIVTLENKEKILEIEQPTTDEPKGVEWLEEQVTLLTEKNNALTAEMDVVKGDFNKILLENQELKNGSLGDSVPNDNNVKTVVVQLFNELQDNHIKLGVDKNGIGNFRIYCPGFLNRMIKFFPFLEEVKRYQ